MLNRALISLAFCLAMSCATAAPRPAPADARAAATAPPTAAPATLAGAQTPSQVLSSAPRERVDADTPRSTALASATFTVPAGWSIASSGPATLLISPDGASSVTIVDSIESNPDAAIAAAWMWANAEFAWPPLKAEDHPARRGWDGSRSYEYDIPPNARVYAQAAALRSGAHTVVALLQSGHASLEKELAQIVLIGDSLRPAGYKHESFAGRTANTLDAMRLAQIDALIERARTELDIPGVSVAIVQADKLIELKGFGVRELGKPQPVDGDSLFLVGSNTKALTTLLLAELVDAGKLRWDMPVTEVLPSFRLGNDTTTQKTQIKHLVCACTGLPRQDLEWIFEFAKATPSSMMTSLASIQPTTDFGATYQYSNQLAAAAGYVAANVVFPGQELGAAYDRAMASRVFGPLGMRTSTFDFDRALRGNHASGHGYDADGKMVMLPMSINRSVISKRPAGGLWSSARDMIRYVQLELHRGTPPGAKRPLLREANLLQRRAAQVTIGEYDTYGMGLIVNTRYDIPIIHHGGSLFGFKADMFWLPDHGVGAVILANADTGGALLGPFMRVLLEQLFDGKPEAAEDMSNTALNVRTAIAQERSKLKIPGDAEVFATLAARYEEPTLGTITLRDVNGVFTLDAGEWQAPLGTRANEDGTTSLIALGGGVTGLPLVIGKSAEGKRQLTVRELQHEYTFVESAAALEPPER